MMNRKLFSLMRSPRNFAMRTVANAISVPPVNDKRYNNRSRPISSNVGRNLLSGAIAVGTVFAFSSSTKCDDAKDVKMYYRMLGNTGLKVSVLSYGFWATFGVKGDLKNSEGVETAKKCLTVARDAGINLFDNAEVYGNGEAEKIMGEAIRQLQQENPEKWRRSELVITTKIFWGGSGQNESGLSRKHIIEGIDAALKRLQVTYVDLVFCHRPDPLTPTETVNSSLMLKSLHSFITESA